MDLFKPLVTASDTIPGIIVPILFICLLWATGIHGMSVVGAVARPIWLTLLDANVQAQAAGQALPNIAPEPFFQWFVWIGGAGSTLSLVLLMLTSKSKYLKSIGRASLIPGICNVNEPMIFGVPLMLNPILAIPFILGPIVTGIITYLAMAANLVARPYTLPPWTLPAPIGAYLATGGDWKAILLVLINMLIVGIIYYPFFKMYEKKMFEEENQSRDVDAASNNVTM
jgi:PTS system cellobiose-specific IIC component